MKLRTIENHVKHFIIKSNGGRLETLGITVVVMRRSTVLDHVEIPVGERVTARDFLSYSNLLMTRFQAGGGEDCGASVTCKHPCARLRILVTAVGRQLPQSRELAEELARSLGREIANDLIAEDSLDALRLAEPISDEDAEREILAEAC